MMSDFSPKVLIVDDIEANLFSLEDALEPLEVGIDRALSGKEAVRLIQDNDYSVVLLDVQMPEMDGFETAQAIFALEKDRHPPIIFVTAISKDEHYIRKGYKSGCVDYLLKPLNLDLVRNKVRFCMDLHLRVLENERLVEKLRAQELDLKRSNEELQQFAYVASHDLQEPIRMVRNYIQLFGKRLSGELDEKATKYMGYIIEGSERMQNLVNDLLVLSRVSSQGKDLEATKPSEVVAVVLRDLKLLIEETGAQVEVENLPLVLADRSQLGQVFQNLIANAIKFRTDRPPKIHIRGEVKDGWCQFTVSDNGIGIDSKYFEQIFVIFQRLHTRDVYQGSGIGLSLCKKIVERHGGQIWLESQVGQGTKFHFTLRQMKD
jgi:signal transduction histidine kinase